MPNIPMVDLDAYFARIGYSGLRTPTRSTLDAILIAHAQAIPFENIDVLLERPIQLTTEALFEKIVARRRGGYCFEQNGLLLAVLEALGFEVTPISARVRIDRPRSVMPARTHLFLRVELEGESWLADVGVGALSLTSTIRLIPDVEQPTPHEPRRLVRDGTSWFHQAAFQGAWNDVCEFTLEAMPLIDRIVANWYTSTCPDSHFKGHLMVAKAAKAGGRLTLQDDVFTIRERDGSATRRRIQSHEELATLLRERFGLELPAGSRIQIPSAAFCAQAS